MPKGYIHATLDLSLPVMRDKFLLELAGDYAQGAYCDVTLNDREYAIVAGLIAADVIDGKCEESDDANTWGQIIDQANVVTRIEEMTDAELDNIIAVLSYGDVNEALNELCRSSAEAIN